MRQIITLKDDWFFAKNKQEQIPQILPENWERVSLPHTWNCLDGQDGMLVCQRTADFRTAL